MHKKKMIPNLNFWYLAKQVIKKRFIEDKITWVKAMIHGTDRYSKHQLFSSLLSILLLFLSYYYVFYKRADMGILFLVLAFISIMLLYIYKEIDRGDITYEYRKKYYPQPLKIKLNKPIKENR